VCRCKDKLNGYTSTTHAHVTYTYTRVCGTWWCTCTDTEPSVHVYRSDTATQTALQLPLRTAVSAHSCTLSQTVQCTQNTLWMCTAMERNMEQKTHFTYNVTVRCVRVTSAALINNKYYILWVRESPKLSTTQSPLWPVLFNIIFHSIVQTARLREKFIEWNLNVLFSQQHGSGMFHSKNFLSRLDQKCMSVFCYSAHYSLTKFNELWIL